jgi:ubiquinone/menaquinone biosynthesis C-methylase UbiE
VSASRSGTVSHPLFARLYNRVLAPGFARQGGEDLRRRLLADLSGTAVEVGCGDGANFEHYPDEVKRIVAVEPESYLRERAAAHSDERVELRDAMATGLPVGNGEADVVVFSLVLCSVDQPAALAEARRVLAPGGQLRFLEHVRASEPGLTRRTQRVLDATVWPRLFGGCHVSRDTVGAIEAAGFTVTELDRFSIPENARGPASAAVLGRAVPA